MTARMRIAVWMVTLLAAGCRQHGGCGPDRCADMPPGAMPAAMGTYACQWQNAQTARGEEDDFVVYQYEWLGGGVQLGPDGRRHAALIAARLPEVPFAVVIAASGNEELDQQRRLAMVEHLASHGLGEADGRVVVGYPEAEGLYGAEAERLGDQWLLGRGAGRQGGILGGGGFGGYGGGGFGLGGFGGGMGLY